MDGQLFPVLLNTGSQVSIISQSACGSLKTPLEKLDDFFEMESAINHNLDYLGYIEAEVNFLHPVNLTVDALLIIVPDGKFHDHVPLLIVTNLLQLCIHHRFVEATPSQEWEFVRVAMNNMDVVSRVHTTKAVTIPSGRKTVVHRLARLPAQCRRIKAITEEPKNSSLPGGLMIDPCY